MPTGEQQGLTMAIELASERLRLWLNPDHGVEWQALQVRRGDEWVSLVPDCRPGGGAARGPGQDAGRDAAPALSAACFMMIPYSNRLRDGAFTFQGKAYQLGRPERHAIHGALRTLPWEVDTVTGKLASCRFDSRTAAQAPDWPWPIEATLEHALLGERLTSEMSLTNHGDSAMPAGFGWHPYFVRDIDGSGPTLTLPVSTVYPDADGDALPDGAAQPLPPALDFREPRELDPDQRIDHCFAGLAGRSRISWPGAGISMILQASPVCSHLVLFNPDAPHFAVEPISNANDGVNLHARGIDAGVQVLEPGDTLRATLTIELAVRDT